MRKFNGEKVLYYNYEAMFRENPIKWTAYFAITIAGALASTIIYRQFPEFLDMTYRKQILVAITIVPFVVGLILYVAWWIKNYSDHRLVITAKDLYLLKGILLVKNENVRLVNVQMFSAQPDNLWELFVGIGTVKFGTSSGEGYEFSLNGMPSIKKISRLVIHGRDQ